MKSLSSERPNSMRRFLFGRRNSERGSEIQKEVVQMQVRRLRCSGFHRKFSSRRILPQKKVHAHVYHNAFTLTMSWLHFQEFINTK